jgi:hypothetical protein
MCQPLTGCKEANATHSQRTWLLESKPKHDMNHVTWGLTPTTVAKLRITVKDYKHIDMLTAL